MSDDMKVFASGAKRAKDEARFDLIPRSGLTRLAARYTMGARKYGEHNWQKGLADPEYVAQFKAHMAAHMMNFFEEGCEKDDNLAAIAWGAMALMEVEERHGHSGVRSRLSIERSREGESSAQAATDPRPGPYSGDTRGGGGRGPERGFGFVATGVASPPAGTPEKSAVNVQRIVFHNGVEEYALKRGDRAGRSDGAKLATNARRTGRKPKSKNRRKK
jgi:hypothetical protein